MACSYKIEMAKKFNHDGKDYIAVVISKRCAVRFEAEFDEFTWRDAFEASYEGRNKNDFEIRIESNDDITVSLRTKAVISHYSANVKVLSAPPLMSPIICSSFKVDKMTWRDERKIIFDSSCKEWNCYLMSSSDYERMHILIDCGRSIIDLISNGIKINGCNGYLVHADFIETKVSPLFVGEYEWKKGINKFLNKEM